MSESTNSDSSSESSIALADLPAAIKSFTLFRRSSSPCKDLSPFKFFCVLVILLSRISKSESISSIFIVSISEIGSILPSTCTMFSSSKHLTTCTIAATSLMWLKNLLPSPSPFEAPLTKPAISENSMVV